MSGGDSEALAALVTGVLRHTPEWVRHDLGSRDLTHRERAEETLAVLITVALTEGCSEPPGLGPVAAALEPLTSVDAGRAVPVDPGPQRGG